MTGIDPAIPQRRAADPGSSVWVAASAGTGKTKVLTDRVISLLLTGTRPERILCLTFTKAAAAEMANRISQRLADWAVWDDATLRGNLAQLRGHPPTEADVTTARRLFAQLLDAPGGFRVETIHAFCQSLLRRFPLEAGLAPHFQVMDDRDSAELLAAAQESVIALAQSTTSPRLAAALALMTARVHETNFPELMKSLTAERGRLRRLLQRHDDDLDRVVAGIQQRLGLAAGDSESSVLAAGCIEAAFDGPSLRAALPILAAGKISDQGRATQMADWLAASPAQRCDRFDLYAGVFLKQDGAIQVRLVTADIAKRHPEVASALAGEAERVWRLAERRNAAVIADATAALLTIGKAMIDSYERQKARRAMLDYDDLILATGRLLQGEGVAAWVLFKLDGGLDHVLIDEAQDTNPDHWAVIRALTSEFFVGRGQHEAASRTIFAVGDRKQSIYSFQGADPQAYEDMRQLLAIAVPAARGRWEEVPLDMSFRSAPAVLEVVDAVFASDAGRAGVVPPEVTLHHRPWRHGAAGLVELWPPTVPSLEDTAEPWKPPVEAIAQDNPRSRLAALLAQKIATMVAGGDLLRSKGRPVQPGDILVLVRRRNAFVDDLVRALKALGVPVAGTDRMVLTEQLAVMDLVALGNMLLLPDDDLTLATVLKGPLIGLSEEDLFVLAWKRPGTLWQSLQSHAAEAPFDAAYRRICDLAERADDCAPHDFFAQVLTHGGKEKLLARLGPEAEDPLDEFMALTLAYERLHPPSLQGFLRWLEEGAIDIKRDMDQSGGATRIMTVHGAKGLQAPIVFLPDTLQVPTTVPKFLWLPDPDDESVRWPIWVPAKGDHQSDSLAAKQRAAAARDDEYRRLLYVALTRAEDRLYITGWETKRTAAAHCWYKLVEAALGDRWRTRDDPLLARFGISDPVREIRNEQNGAIESSRSLGAAPAAVALPDWARQPPAAEPSPPRPLYPSRPDSEEPALPSPRGVSSVGNGGAMQRGTLIHRLLQVLPDCPAAARPEAARRFLARSAADADPQDRQALIDEVIGLLATAAFAPLFAAGSRAEVPLVGRWGDRLVSGQVDRLVVTDESILLVDYKTGTMPSPAAPVPAAYRQQMAAYRAILRAVYPDRPVRCLLLWTAGPRLDLLSEESLDTYE